MKIVFIKADNHYKRFSVYFSSNIITHLSNTTLLGWVLCCVNYLNVQSYSTKDMVNAGL